MEILDMFGLGKLDTAGTQRFSVDIEPKPRNDNIYLKRQEFDYQKELSKFMNHEKCFKNEESFKDVENPRKLRDCMKTRENYKNHVLCGKDLKKIK